LMNTIFSGELVYWIPKKKNLRNGLVALIEKRVSAEEPFELPYVSTLGIRAGVVVNLVAVQVPPALNPQSETLPKSHNYPSTTTSSDADSG